MREVLGQRVDGQMQRVRCRGRVQLHVQQLLPAAQLPDPYL